MQLSVYIRSLLSRLFPAEQPRRVPELFAGGEIRLLDASEKHLFRDHLLRLDGDTRRSRFAMHATDAFLRSYVETSFTLDTVIYAYLENGIVRGTAELRSLGNADTAEAAFCVEQDWRRLGIGTRLMDLLLQEARARETRHIYINCLATNRKMQALARKFSADMSFEAGDVIGHISPPEAAPRDRLRQWVLRHMPKAQATLSRWS